MTLWTSSSSLLGEFFLSKFMSPNIFALVALISSSLLGSSFLGSYLFGSTFARTTSSFLELSCSSDSYLETRNCEGFISRVSIILFPCSASGIAMTSEISSFSLGISLIMEI